MGAQFTSLAAAGLRHVWVMLCSYAETGLEKGRNGRSAVSKQKLVATILGKCTATTFRTSSTRSQTW